MEASQLVGGGNQFLPFTKDWNAAMERKACVSRKNRNVISVLLHFSWSCACEPFLRALAPHEPPNEMHYPHKHLRATRRTPEMESEVKQSNGHCMCCLLKPCLLE